MGTMNMPEFPHEFSPEYHKSPKVPEMQKAISRLRMLLASIKGKEDELDSLVTQFERQLERAPRHAVHGGNPLENTLSIMGEIQERLDGAASARSHLNTIRRQAENELVALNITGRINEARHELSVLKADSQIGQDVDLRRIDELERLIAEASNRAAKAITGEFDVPEL